MSLPLLLPIFFYAGIGAAVAAVVIHLLNRRRYKVVYWAAMDFLLGNYQNERVIGSNPERDQVIQGHVREIFDFETGDSLFKVQTPKTVFPLLNMKTADGLPIGRSQRVVFSFSDPGGNFVNSTIPFRMAEDRWKVQVAATGRAVPRREDGWYHVPLAVELALLPRSESVQGGVSK